MLCSFWKGCLNLRVKGIIPNWYPIGNIRSVLVYRHWLLPVDRYWLLPVNSPYSGSKLKVKHVFPKGSNDRYTVGEFIGTGFYQYYSRHGAQVKNYSKLKLQILNADFSPQFLMRPAGLSWLKIMRPL